MKTIVGLISAILMFGMAALPSMADENPAAGEKKLFTKHFNETLFDITRHALYSVEVILNNREYEIGKGVIGIVVHNDKDQDVKGAQLTIEDKNLETGEIAKPTGIEDKHNGLYIVSGLKLFMVGRWELKITVDKKGVKDSVAFKLPEAMEKLYPKGRYYP